jgi:hypothetical protein
MRNGESTLVGRTDGRKRPVFAFNAVRRAGTERTPMIGFSIRQMNTLGPLRYLRYLAFLNGQASLR